MRRLILALLFCSLAFSASAQDTKRADEAFKEGKYEVATRLYNTAGQLLKDKTQRDKIYALSKKCSECQKKLTEANGYYNDHKYKEASSAYKELLILNPTDPLAKKRIKAIPDLIEQEKEDEAMWGMICAIASLENYNNYLAKYPNGKHKKEALTAIQGIKAEIKKQEQAKQEEERKYEVFRNDPTIDHALAYLKNYPEGMYASKVRDRLVDLYCNQNNYTDAYKFASGSKIKYIQEHQKEYKRQLNAEKERLDFNSFQKEQSESAAVMFLSKHQDGYYTEQVSEWLVKELCKKNKIAEAKKYAITTESHEYITSVEEDIAYNIIMQSNSSDKEKEYLDSFPNGKHHNEVAELYVQAQIQSNNFEEAKKYARDPELLTSVNTAQEEHLYDLFKSHHSSYYARDYLDSFPEGHYQAEVRKWVVKEACKTGDFFMANKYAASDENLVKYVDDKVKKKREKLNREYVNELEFRDFSKHFLDGTIGYNDNQGKLPIGLMYSYVPQRFGFYVGGAYDGDWSAVVGPVVRLSKNNSFADMQLYAGVGYASSPSFMADAGLRFGFSSTKFSVLDFSIGTYYYDKTFIPYIGVNITLALAIPLVILLL